MGEIILVTKDIHFDMAHAIDNHDGKCRFIHGHTFHLSVTVKGQPINDLDSANNGMVIDFRQLKEILQDEIESKFDHTLVLQEKSKYRILEEVSSERLVIVPYPPTCENLLSDFVNRIQVRLPDSVTLHSVRLRETPTSVAEWHHAESAGSTVESVESNVSSDTSY